MGSPHLARSQRNAYSDLDYHQARAKPLTVLDFQDLVTSWLRKGWAGSMAAIERNRWIGTPTSIT